MEAATITFAKTKTKSSRPRRSQQCIFYFCVFLFLLLMVYQLIWLVSSTMYGDKDKAFAKQMSVMLKRVSIDEEAGDERVDGENNKETKELGNEVEARMPKTPISARPTTVKRLPKNFVPRVYQSKNNWNVVPIVVNEYKLIFFNQGKVASTEFKKLLRRMMHLDDWQKGSDKGNIPHNPSYNGLKYLSHYPLKKALDMLTDPEWTRAIFVRDPKERFLSAYLDKANKNDGIYVTHHCCNSDIKKKNSCGKQAAGSLFYFTKLVRDKCRWDNHWQPQSRRMDKELWGYVNFVGQFDSLAEDTRRMLERLGNGTWEEFGASGWGKFGNESAFVGSNMATHGTSARTKLSQYINDTIVENMLDDFYFEDYMHPKFNFTMYTVVSDP